MKPTYPTPIQQLEELRCELKEAAVFNPYALASLQAIADTFGKSLECLVRDDPEFAEWAAEYPAGLAATKSKLSRVAQDSECSCAGDLFEEAHLALSFDLREICSRLRSLVAQE